jgi:NADH-quinone oxidoreductase subunit K
VDGQAFAVFIIVAAAAEAVVGLGIILVAARGRETLNSEDMDLLKW